MNRHENSQPAKQLNLKDAETYELAVRLAKLQGGTLNNAVKTALREKLARDQHDLTKQERFERILALSDWYSSLPDKDTRTADEILGYDENGLPT